MIAKIIFVVTFLIFITELPLEIVMYRLSFKKRLVVVLCILIVLVVSAYYAFK